MLCEHEMGRIRKNEYNRKIRKGSVGIDLLTMSGFPDFVMQGTLAPCQILSYFEFNISFSLQNN